MPPIRFVRLVARCAVTASVLAFMTMLAGCGGTTVSRGQVAQHKHLSAAEGACAVLGNGAAFYVCQPNFTIALSSSTNALRWTVHGAAASANGRKVFTDTHGVAQVVLKNGWPFGANGATGGVTVTGNVAQGTIVMVSFSPGPPMIPGYAVWKLPRDAVRLEANADGRSTPRLLADGRRVKPRLVIAPSRRLHDRAAERLLRRDVRKLEAVADGNVDGACSFYKTVGPNSTDASCAAALGVRGKRRAIESGLSSAMLLSYNGFTIAMLRIDGGASGLILDDGHFRVLDSSVAG